MLNVLLQSNPGDPAANHLAALVSADSGRFDRAVAQMQDAIAGDRRNPGYHFDLGLMLNAQGRYEQAVHAFKKALKRQPRMPQAQNALGIALMRLQHTSEAVRSFNSAITLDPDYVEPYNNLSLAYIELGFPRKAADLLEQAVRLNPDYVPAVKNLGTAYLRQGLLRKAQMWHERALKLRPGDLSILQNVASAYASQTLYTDAAVALAEMLSIDPTHATANKHYGKVLVAQQKFEEAIPYFLRALNVFEGDAELHDLLGTALTESGKLADAVIHYRKAAEVDPRHVPNLVAIKRKAALCSQIEAITELTSLLEQQGLSKNARVEAYFKLGELYDGVGDVDCAFENYEAGNDSIESGFDRQRFGQLTGTVISEFSDARLCLLPSTSNTSKLPVFIVGLPRTGKTLLGDMLSKHSGIVVPDEVQQVGSYFDLGIHQEASEYRACLASITEDLVQEAAAEYLDLCSRIGRSPTARVANTLPLNFFHLGLIQLLFPHAKIINIERDPLDVGIECFFKNFHNKNIYSFSHDLADIGFMYRKYQTLMQHWRRVLNIEIFDVRYEAIVSAPSQTLNEVFRFLELEGVDETLTGSDFELGGRIGLAGQAETLTDRYVGRWKPYQKHLVPLVEELEKA